MQLTIIAADFIPPPTFAARAPTPALDALLADAAVATGLGQALEEAVLAAFGLDASAPIAALTRLVDLPDQPPDGAWLRADPVHFAVQRDGIRLADSHVLRPTAEEMAAIADTLNRHFAQDGLDFRFPDPARGYLRIAADDVPAATPLWRTIAADLFDQLPRNGTRTRWRAVGNDAQMLLHAHPVNAARESRGVPTINGLWLWGGGTLGDGMPHPAFDTVTAGLALARGASCAAGTACLPLPARFSELPAANDGERTMLAVLHAPSRARRGGDADAWRETITAIDREWIGPAHAAFEAGRLDALTLVLANDTISLNVRAARRPAWRHWWARLAPAAAQRHRGLAAYG